MFQSIKTKDINSGRMLKSFFQRECEYAFQAYEYTKVGFPFIKEKNYLGESFGHSICVSVNNVIAHGSPTDSIFGEGDIISVDCGISLPYGKRQLHLDAAFTTRVGPKCNLDWVPAPLEALKRIIELQPTDTRQIAQIIRDTAKDHNLKQVVSMTGHGIGYKLHEAPAIHNAPGEFLPVELFDGLCFCAEPIFVNPGISKDSSFISPTCIGDDGWEVATVSGDPASHFETTFGIVDGQIIDLVGITEWIF
jgi:methionyl aminopeptidase